jgi:hypothetical protein
MCKTISDFAETTSEKYRQQFGVELTTIPLCCNMDAAFITPVYNSRRSESIDIIGILSYLNPCPLKFNTVRFVQIHCGQYVLNRIHVTHQKVGSKVFIRTHAYMTPCSI